MLSKINTKDMYYIWNIYKPNYGNVHLKNLKPVFVFASERIILICISVAHKSALQIQHATSDLKLDMDLDWESELEIEMEMEMQLELEWKLEMKSKWCLDRNDISCRGHSMCRHNKWIIDVFKQYSPIFRLARRKSESDGGGERQRGRERGRRRSRDMKIVNVGFHLLNLISHFVCRLFVFRVSHLF